jgi:hypothetical protein
MYIQHHIADGAAVGLPECGHQIEDQGGNYACAFKRRVMGGLETELEATSVRTRVRSADCDG